MASFRDPEDRIDLDEAYRMIESSSLAACRTVLKNIVHSIDTYSGDVNEILASIFADLDGYGMLPLLDDEGEE